MGIGDVIMTSPPFSRVRWRTTQGGRFFRGFCCLYNFQYVSVFDDDSEVGLDVNRYLSGSGARFSYKMGQGDRSLSGGEKGEGRIR